ncbi:hypothetical protein Taro_041904, partial [Colocasia esculenta]|nr:hypothetical protein [Colocasia esculenta]
LRNNPEIPAHLHHSLGHATHVTIPNGNTVNVTVDLSSFGRPKEEKLKPHLRPLREAATTTWSKHSLGHSQPSQPGSQRGQPATHHRQRETSDVREPPEDTHSRHGDTAAARRIVHSLFSGYHGGTSSAATVSVFIQGHTPGGTKAHSSLLSPSLGLGLRELLTSSSSLSRRLSGTGGLVAVEASGRASAPRPTDGSPNDTMSSRDPNTDPILPAAFC